MGSGQDRRIIIRSGVILFTTIVGAGIFGLPYVIAKAGFPVGLFWMVLLAGAVTLTHLMFGEVILATSGQHRMIGYVRLHLGKWAGRIEAVASILGLYGGALAYMVLGGLFFSELARPIVPLPAIAGSVVIFVVIALSAWEGVNFFSRVDFWLTLVKIAAFLLLIGWSLRGFQAQNLAVYDLSKSFLPYGVILFALGGLAGVTEIREISGRRPHVLRRGIVLGTLMAAALTALFAIATVAATGAGTTQEVLAGLNARFGGPVPVIGAAAGFLAVLTAYLVFSLFLREQLMLDIKLSKPVAWLAAVCVPFLLFLAGIRSFGRILELVGATLVGIEGSFVGLMYLKLRKAKHPGILKIPVPLVWLLIGVYAAGALYELIFRVIAAPQP